MFAHGAQSVKCAVCNHVTPAPGPGVGARPAAAPPARPPQQYGGYGPARPPPPGAAPPLPEAPQQQHVLVEQPGGDAPALGTAPAAAPLPR
jgi:hypothetical protein